MFYNENFDNSYDFNSRNHNDNEKNENNGCKKGYCTVKVIQECCYPSYFDYEDKKDDHKNDNNYFQSNKNFDENDYDYNKLDKKEDFKNNGCCGKENKWEDKNSCDHKENNKCFESQKNYYEKEEKKSCHTDHDNKCCCKQRNNCCGICSCFRRW